LVKRSFFYEKETILSESEPFIDKKLEVEDKGVGYSRSLSLVESHFDERFTKNEIV